MDKDNNMDVDMDTSGNFFVDPTFTDLPSAPPSTPNSSASSPPIGNDEYTSLAPQGFLQNILSQFNNGVLLDVNLQNTLITDNNNKALSRRGPGRPRKENPLLLIRNLSGKTHQKRKMINKDGSIQQTTNINTNDISIRNPQMQLVVPSSSESSNTGFPDIDKQLQIQQQQQQQLINIQDETPYFTEKYPGKLCCLCNLSERSSLGQGDLLRIEITDININSNNNDEITQIETTEEIIEHFKDEDKCINKGITTINQGQIGCRRLKNSRKTMNNEDLNELDRIGHLEIMNLKALLETNYLYIHQQCAMWSLGANDGIIDGISSPQLEHLIEKSLKRKCAFCSMYGASLICRMSCTKIYHMPCAAAASCFLIIDNYNIFCIDHINQATLLSSNDVNIDCRHCGTHDDIGKLIMCNSCGDHYHTTCVGLADLPDTRAGWNCSQCSKCQICRLTDGSEGRAVKCEQCQKVYHANCLRPIISSVPKYGWKCRRCRICTDCGSRTPGAGTSSRWHCHYSICDSCYQQRNKGLSCPICHKAYRAAAHKEMVKCNSCNRFVHSTCDNEADLSAYQKRKEQSPDYEYSCPLCKSGLSKASMLFNQQRIDNFDMASSYGSQTPGREQQFTDIDIDLNDKINGSSNDYNLNYGKPFEAFRLSKKRIGIKELQNKRGGGAGGKVMLQRHNSLTQIGRKRSVRGKNRQLMLLGSSQNQIERSNSRHNEDDMGNEKKLLLCAAKDKFVLSQDICVMCGSVGMDQEAALITCAQCGQCYHPFCVNVKVSKVMLLKGWRCLDCTVCEGCGQKNDEARLILCDECDISYHIYCMNPPLDTVPNGNWKCKWCAVCQKCGRNTPGKNSAWRNGFLECGPCASQANCCVCLQCYKDNELIIQCGNCERWLHCQCDKINNEEEAKLCDNLDYQCILCRPKDVPYAPLMAAKYKNQNQTHISTITTKLNNCVLLNRQQSQLELESAMQGVDESAHWVDGVCVSERGLTMIKALQTEMKKKRKLKINNEGLHKDSGILAAIESVVSGSSANNSGLLDDDDDELSKKKQHNYKDGMIWTGAVDSPPEGFFISTNDEGVHILRKKRQRNLQKLGIGGFNVRNRTLKKDGVNTEEGNNEQTAAMLLDKKKKLARKKLKSKLCDTYPTYLQEAFFGKSLLETQTACNSLQCESDHSEDLEHNPMIYEQSLDTQKVNVTTPNMHIKIEIDSQDNTLEHNSNLTGPISDTSSSTIPPAETGAQMQELNAILTPKLEMDIKEEDMNTNRILITTDNQTMVKIDNTDDIGNRIYVTNNSNHNNNNLNLDITNANNIPGNNVHVINNNFINHHVNLQQNKPQPPLSQQQSTQLHLQTQQPQQQQQQQPTQTINNFTQHTIQTAVNNDFGANGIQTVRRNVFNNTIVHQNNNLNNNSNIHTQSTDIQGNNNLLHTIETTQLPLMVENEPTLQIRTVMTTNTDVRLQNNDVKPTQLAFVEMKSNDQPDSTQTFTNPAREGTALKSYLLPTKTPLPTNLDDAIEPSAVGTQKTAEKMRRDESLGEMATISAVLYANTQHPELKQMYPNWSDRCKQILKRWRSLSTEKKAPFLQHAKDNRSALRMRRAQQDQEKICFQQKTLKEQEQERIWKQHQAKAKEAQSTAYGTEAFGITVDGNTTPSRFMNTPPTGTLTNNAFKTNYITANMLTTGTGTSPVHSTDNNKTTIGQHILDTGTTTTANISIANSKLNNDTINISGDNVDNKQLRTLLQRQEYTSTWLANDTKLQINEQSTTITQQQQQQQQQGTYDTNKLHIIPRKHQLLQQQQQHPQLLTNIIKHNVLTKQQEMTEQSGGGGGGVGGNGTPSSSSTVVGIVETNNNVNSCVGENTVGTTVQATAVDLERLDQYENAGFGDILGGLGEGDDDELFQSLTSEIGEDFNILEYADPELDALASSQNLLNKLDFDDSDKNT